MLLAATPSTGCSRENADRSARGVQREPCHKTHICLSVFSRAWSPSSKGRTVPLESWRPAYPNRWEAAVDFGRLVCQPSYETYTASTELRICLGAAVETRWGAT